jgi:hypothetical protein
LADRLLVEHAVPPNALVDAVHIAAAAVNAIDYLLGARITNCSRRKAATPSSITASSRGGQCWPSRRCRASGDAQRTAGMAPWRSLARYPLSMFDNE